MLLLTFCYWKIHARRVKAEYFKYKTYYFFNFKNKSRCNWCKFEYFAGIWGSFINLMDYHFSAIDIIIEPNVKVVYSFRA